MQKQLHLFPNGAQPLSWPRRSEARPKQAGRARVGQRLASPTPHAPVRPWGGLPHRRSHLNVKADFTNEKGLH